MDPVLLGEITGRGEEGKERVRHKIKGKIKFTLIWAPPLPPQ